MSAFVIAPPLPLRAGLLALSPLPASAEARAQVARFAPALVVSMTETAEMASLGAADLPAWLAANGIAWHHFPVADFGVPAPDADWPALSQRAQDCLASGRRVLLHCRGGIGRSGMVALKLMIEAGADPDQALQQLRAVRPGAVETPQQHAWARQP